MPEAGPSALNPVKIDSYSLTISISPPSVSNANGVIRGYIITIYDKLRDQFTNITVNTTSQTTGNMTSTLQDNIKPFTDYEIKVVPFNDKGIGQNATTISIKTQESGKDIFKCVSRRVLVRTRTAVFI